jgi:hypothetical protein
METRIVDMCQDLPPRMTSIRTDSEEAWISAHASGSLRKQRLLGMRYRDLYIHERIAYTLGYGWEVLKTSRVTFNDALAEGDSRPHTEMAWHAERTISLNPYPEDVYQVKYLIIEDEGGKRREGVGMILSQTSIPWIPSGSIVLTLISEYKNGHWEPAINPC